MTWRRGQIVADISLYCYATVQFTSDWCSDFFPGFSRIFHYSASLIGGATSSWLSTSKKSSRSLIHRITNCCIRRCGWRHLQHICNKYYTRAQSNITLSLIFRLIYFGYNRVSVLYNIFGRQSAVNRTIFFSFFVQIVAVHKGKRKRQNFTKALSFSVYYTLFWPDEKKFSLSNND